MAWMDMEDNSVCPSDGFSVPADTLIQPGRSWAGTPVPLCPGFWPIEIVRQVGVVSSC